MIIPINARETATGCLRGLRIGCAGWAITKAADGMFPDQGTILERYARQLSAVEINSSFYRSHRPTTYRRWAASTPPSFRFAVKAPRSITHDARFTNVEPELARFLDEIQNLGDKLGPVLIQLPPSLAFDSPSVHLTFAQLRQRFSGSVVCEPRHESWLSPVALTALSHFGIPLVQADPAIVGSCVPRITDGPVAYHRLHGSPRMYYSSYGGEFLSQLAGQIANELACHQEVWCIFDNTAAGAAVENAFELQAMVDDPNVVGLETSSALDR